MKISVIISTYNSPEWLEKVIWGYSVQEYRNFEMLVADDGSTAETEEVIDKMRLETGLCIKHVWQKDLGFRKCRILNKAIQVVEADYVVFSDGDCIPRKDFLAVNVSEAKPGCFLTGGYNKLPMSLSRLITKEDIISGCCFDLKWLRANGLKANRKNMKLVSGPKTARFLNAITPTKCTFKGANGSVWLKDIFAVNGFDERMPWGGEDRDFGVRLVNYGIRPKHTRFNAVVIHLDHKRSYKNPELVQKNRKLRLDNERSGVFWTEYGISQLPDFLSERTATIQLDKG